MSDVSTERTAAMDAPISNLHYTDERLVRICDALNARDHDWVFYEDRIGPAPQRIADVGCGTGTFALRLAAAGHTVIGVDPAPAMLDFARGRPGAAGVTWIDGVTSDLPRELAFDCATMTGHAFQCLLTDESVGSTLYALRERLQPGGRLMFESRNPVMQWWLRWHGQMSKHDLRIEDGSVEVTYDVLSERSQIVIFETHYRFTHSNAHLVDRSALRFMPQSDIAEHLRRAGFNDVEWLGGWDGTAFDEGTSPEIIAIAR